ncbi:Tc5 transposase DNA-binding domain-containing protein [Hirsutella rhossiliensis]
MDEAGIMEGLGRMAWSLAVLKNDLYKRRRLVLGSGRRSSRWLESDGFVAGVDGEATFEPSSAGEQQQTQKNAKNVANAFNSHLPTSDWQSDTSQIAWSTPRRSQDLKVQVVQFNQLDDDVPTKRLLFRKITKGFDEKDGLLAKAQLQIQALETQLAAVKPKKEEGGHEPEFEVRQY